MTTTSERATASIKQMSSHDQRQHLSEMVRVAECAWIEKQAKAGEMEDSKPILLAQMVMNLRKEGAARSDAEAERIARTSEEFKKFLREFHNIKKQANLLKAGWRHIDREYWSSVSHEASERAQMRMSRS